PLTNEEWQRSIDVPVALFGIGAGGPVASKCETLIRKAVYVSGRDDQSLTALRRFRDDVRFVPDPVLADSYYHPSSVDTGYHPSSVDTSNTLANNGNKLWLIKHNQHLHGTGLSRMIDPERDQICFVEPFLDFPLVKLLPTVRPLYFVDDLIALIDQSEIV